MTRSSGVFVLIWLVVLATAIGIIIRTQFATDMSAFLPRAPEPAQQALVDQLRDGAASRLILIAVTEGQSQIRAEISRRMAGKLRDDGADFASVDNGESGTSKTDQSYVWRNRYVLSPEVTPARFSPQGLRRGLEQDLELLSSGLGPLFKGTIGPDPTGETLAILRALGTDAQRRLTDGVWTSADRAHAFILAQTMAPGFDIDRQELALTRIQQSFAEAQAATVGGEATRLLATGPGIFAIKARAGMKHDVSLYSTLAAAAIIALLLVIYRSPVVLLLTLAPVVSGALCGLAAVSLSFGFVHGITIGFGVTLIGEAVDYPIYLFGQTAPGGGPSATLRRIWPTLRLGVLVSICGFAAMLFSGFTGFVQLGVLTIVGLAAAILVTRFVLPSLVPAGFGGTKDFGLASWLLSPMLGARRLQLPLLLLTGAAIVLIGLRGGDLWDTEIASLSPVPAADQSLDRTLRREIGAPDIRYVVIVTGPDRQKVLESSERSATALRDAVGAGALSSFDSPDRLLPSEATQVARKAALPDRATLTRNLDQALDGLPFRHEIFAPFIDDVATAKEAPLLARSALDGTALSLKLDSLLIEKPGLVIAVLPLHGVVEPQRIAERLAAAPGAGRMLDLKFESDRLLDRYRNEALLLASLGSAAIAALLLGHFRSLRRSATVLAPLACAVALTMTFEILRHHKLSIFNLFGLLLVVAVGSNYCLFFERGNLTGEDGGRTVLSLLLANLCTVTGFGALSLSDIPVLYGLGGTVAVGTALSLIAAAILIPGIARPAPR